MRSTQWVVQQLAEALTQHTRIVAKVGQLDGVAKYKRSQEAAAAQAPSGGDAEVGDDASTQHRNLAAADASVICGGQTLSSKDMINVNAGLDALALDKSKLRRCRNDIGQMRQQLTAQKAQQGGDIDMLKKRDGVPDGAVMFWPWTMALPKDYLVMDGKAGTKDMTAVSAALKAGQLIVKSKNRCLDPDTNTCHGNATCTAFIGGAGHSCACPSPYVGDGVAKGSGCKCGSGWSTVAKNGCVDIDDCAASPCKYGGKCADTGPNNFTCACTKGWYGSTCATKDPCVGKPCKNKAACTPAAAKAPYFTCKCVGGYMGATCAQDSCAASLCAKVANTVCRRDATKAPYYLCSFKTSAAFVTALSSASSGDKLSLICNKAKHCVVSGKRLSVPKNVEVNL